MPNTRERMKQHIVISDADLVAAGWTNYDFQPVDAGQVATPVKNTDISQGGIGDCYLLASLSSLIELDPNFLDRFIKISPDGKTANVTLYTLTREITYDLDATRLHRKRGVLHLAQSDINDHTHDAIYLLEKAFAIHRMHTKTLPGDTLTKQDLKFTGKQLTLNVESLETSKTKIEDVNMVDYRSALRGGLPAEVFTALNLAGKVIDINQEKFLQQFSQLITKMPPGTVNPLSVQGREFDAYIKSLFPGEENTAGLFVNFFQNLDEKCRKDLADFINDTFNLSDDSHVHLDALHECFKSKFHAMFSGADRVLPGLNDDLRNRLIAALVQQTPHRRRGYGDYTEAQNLLFAQIRENIRANHPATLTSMQVVGRSRQTSDTGAGVNVSKGLVGSHVYQVVDCYTRNNLKYVLVRNPWSELVRDYEMRESAADAGTEKYLSAREAAQITDAARAKLGELRNSARNFTAADISEKYRANGYCELELTDIIKRFDRLEVTNDPVHPASVPLKTSVSKVKLTTFGEAASAARTTDTAIAETSRRPRRK